MIATTAPFWKAFFDPDNPRHEQACAEILVFDRESIVISQLALSETVSWLLSKGKNAQRDWFLDYASNTANVRVFCYGPEEFAVLAELSVYENTTLVEASVRYLKRYLNCGVTEY